MLELPEQHRRDEIVELRFLERALAHQLDEVQVAVGLGQFDVHAGAHREHACFRLVGGDEMAVRVGAVAQLPDRVVVRDDESLEAPFLAQHVAQQPAVGVRRHAVDLVVRRHDADGAGLRAIASLNGCRNVSRSTRIETFTGAQFMPDSGWPCAAKCFSVASTCFLSRNVAVALEAAHRGDAHARDEVRIFAERLLDAAPARIARHVDHRRERLMRAARRALPRRSSCTATRPARD